METLTIEMTDAEAELIRQHAADLGMSASDFLRETTLAKIDDLRDLGDLRQAIADDTGERFSHEQVLTDLG